MIKQMATAFLVAGSTLDTLADFVCIHQLILERGAKPHALSTPRRVAIPLLPRVKEELERMEQLGVIERVEQPTEWCAGLVVVPKANGKVRLCVDLTKLMKVEETY